MRLSAAWLRSRAELLLLGLGALVAIGAVALGLRRSRQAAARAAYEATLRLPDTLRVVTLSGATTYFTIQGEEMGYQYDLLKLYAESVQLPYTLTVLPNLDSIHRRLADGRADLSITPEAVNRSNQERWRLAGPTTEHALVLVQRRRSAPTDSTYIQNVAELIGKPLYVLSGAHHEQRLKNLGAQLGTALDIRVLQSDTVNSEDLIGLVATDSIDYTVVDSELARLAQRYYPNTDISLEVGFPQRLRWVTALDRRGLAESLDRWAESRPSQQGAKSIYRRYFEAYRLQGEGVSTGTGQGVQRLPVVPKGAISLYDEIFKSYAKDLPWTWHLLAAIAYQESRFQAGIIGWSGARGLMGIMPATGRIYGATKEMLLEPETSVRVSVRCLRDTERAFLSVPDVEERLKFTLAGYNAGIGHVQDAQRLAEKYGADKHIWTGSVEKYILLKSEPKYYSDPVCKYGYLRGRETYRYAQEVQERYQNYQRIVKE